MIPHTSYDSADFGIENFRSSHDQDKDGVDDQTDILESARAYTATNPKYKSRYYEGGYPDDGYGVCTDVVAFALRGAGYDLMELVDEDIALHPLEYDIDEADKNGRAVILLCSANILALCPTAGIKKGFPL